MHTNFLKPLITPSASALAVAVIPERVTTDKEVVTLELEETEGLKVGNLTLQQVTGVRELTLQFKELFSSTPGSTDMAIHEIQSESSYLQNTNGLHRSSENNGQSWYHRTIQKCLVCTHSLC